MSLTPSNNFVKSEVGVLASAVTDSVEFYPRSSEAITLGTGTLSQTVASVSSDERRTFSTVNITITSGQFLSDANLTIASQYHLVGDLVTFVYDPSDIPGGRAINVKDSKANLIVAITAVDSGVTRVELLDDGLWSVTETTSNPTTGVSSITGTSGQVLASASVGAITLSLAGNITGVNSITAAAGNNLGLNAGSSGAAISLGQGTGGGATITVGATSPLRAFRLSDATTYTGLSFNNAIASTNLVGIYGGGDTNLYLQHTNFLIFQRSGAEKMRLSAGDNLLIGGTTDITGAGGLKVFGTTASTSSTTGALVVTGGVGIGGNTETAGYISIRNDTGLLVRESSGAGSYGQLTKTAAGAFTITNSLAAGNIALVAGSTGSVTVANAVVSTSTTTGALTVAGGVGIAGAVFTGGNLSVTGTAAIGVGASADVALRVDSTTLVGASQYGVHSFPAFTSSATGAAMAGIFGVVTAAAAFTVAQGYAVRAYLPTLGAGSAITTLAGVYVDNQGASGVTNAYGIDIAAQSGAATTNVGLRNAGTTLLTNATASTSTTTGALVVTGGLGVGGSVNIAGNAAITGTLNVANTTAASSATSGGAAFAGGLGVAANIIHGGGTGWGVTNTATAAGTTTLVSTSKMVQVFTGTTTQSVVLPAANLWGAGIAVVYIIKNRSTGLVTVSRAGSDTIDGSTSVILGTGDALTIASDGVSAWEII